MKLNNAKVITVTSSKGGVGKTTTTLLLASVYSNLGKKVLLVDLDLYAGSIAFSLNVETKNNIYNLYDDIVNNRFKGDELDKYLYAVNDNISILSAPKDPRQANKIDKDSIEIMINAFSFNFDIILIDTNHILDVTNMMAFEYSSKIVDIFVNDAMNLKDTKTFVAICKNTGEDNMILVLNNATDDRKKYFSNYDIKTIVKKNIDYVIPSSLYIRNYDSLLMDGKLLKYFTDLKPTNPKSKSDIVKLALKLIEDAEEGIDEDEKK